MTYFDIARYNSLSNEEIKVEAADLVTEALELDTRIRELRTPEPFSNESIQLEAIIGARADVGTRLKVLEPLLDDVLACDDLGISTEMVDKLANWVLKTGLMPVFVNDRFTGEFTTDLALKNQPTH